MSEFHTVSPLAAPLPLLVRMMRKPQGPVVRLPNFLRYGLR